MAGLGKGRVVCETFHSFSVCHCLSSDLGVIGERVDDTSVEPVMGEAYVIS